jgi:hypothetical protein
MAVIMPIKAIIPKAMMATVIPARNLFPLTVRQARFKESKAFM